VGLSGIGYLVEVGEVGQDQIDEAGRVVELEVMVRAIDEVVPAVLVFVRVVL
jgi:hypothetical protein